MNIAKKVNYITYVEKGEYAPRPDFPWVKRENVALIITYSNNYLFLKWNQVNYQMSLVTGGIDPGEKKEETVKREIVEETGYYDIDRIIPVDGINVSEFFVEHKQQNRRAIYYPYLVILKTLEQEPISEEESKEHECIWCEGDKLDSVDLFENHRYMLNRRKK